MLHLYTHIQKPHRAHTKRGRLWKTLLPPSLLPSQLLSSSFPQLEESLLVISNSGIQNFGRQVRWQHHQSAVLAIPQLNKSKREKHEAGQVMSHASIVCRGLLLTYAWRRVPTGDVKSPSGNVKCSYWSTWNVPRSFVQNTACPGALAVPRRYSNNNTQKCLPLKHLDLK